MHERITLMEALTCMFSQILKENEDLEEPTLSIVSLTTLTLSLLEETLEAATITRQKMEKLSQEDLSARPTGLMDQMFYDKELSWLNSLPSKTVIHFGNVYKSWLQDYCYEISPVLTVMHLGDSDQEYRNIRHRKDFASKVIHYENLTNGVMNTLAEIIADEE